MGVNRGAVERQVGSEGEQVGGARADFVANLGRRIAELSSLLKGLDGEPGSVRLRDEMRRKLHALAAASRLLRFARLADELAHAERLLDQAAAKMQALGRDELVDLRAVLECAPALAWGQASADSWMKQPVSSPNGAASTNNASSDRKPMESVRVPVSPQPKIEDQLPASIALVVGSSILADALTLGKEDLQETVVAGAFEVELTHDCASAIDLARALAPDVAVIDAELPGAVALATALLNDPLTEPVPIVVVGSWAKLEDAAPFVAMGVAKTLVKPVSPDALRRACNEALSTYVRREVKRTPLGQLSLDDLGARLSEELHRGLCDAARKGRDARFDLGEGSEVLAAVWSAVARIRDLVTIQSSGTVQFSEAGPEGALPIASWMSNEANEGRVGRSNEGRTASAPSLDGKTIVVADDDPAVTWFLAGVFRAAGAAVHEAHDGARALELAFQFAPDLVVSDVLMPNLDGFALCRALKRDLVLRDVPVILLSWKEDLLQRVRELGANADGYLRKEATASSIVQRASEVLRARHRVAERLQQGGEVRGRLDGLTATTLLRLACEHRPSSIVTVRDATFLYEIELRCGRPARATRTATDGAFIRGPSVLASLLGVGSGRFVVAPPSDPSFGKADLAGSLDEQLHQYVASARAAQRLLSGSSLA